MTRTSMSTGKEPRTLIVGLGKTGLSCASFCQRKDIDYSIIDSRNDPPAIDQLRAIDPEVEIIKGGFDVAVLEGIERMVVSPGVSLKEPFIQQAEERGINVIGDIELFAQYASAPVVAISGSNGKSTVTSLVGEMAKLAGLNVRIGGNLGTPAIDLLDGSEDEIQTEIDFYILELSSFQLEATHSLNAHAAVVLNVSPDHMDRYDSFAQYAAAKQVAYAGDGVMVVNKDDATVMAMLQDELSRVMNRKVLLFSMQQPLAGEFGIFDVDGQPHLAHGEQALLATSELKIPGKHNQANALAALALGYAMKLPMVAMLEALRNFAGLAHRTQWVANINDVDWYNDSKATNPGATESAIAGMPGSKILIAGGQGKDADFSQLADVISMHDVRGVVLLGEDADLIASVLHDDVLVERAESMDDAVRRASSMAHAGESVLLSPACASFDMFENFEDRGECFTALVKALAEGASK